MKHSCPLLVMMACAIVLSLASCKGRTAEASDSSAGGALWIPSIGLVFDIGTRSDASFNNSAYEGLVMLARDLGGHIRDDPDVDFGQRLDIRVLESKHAGADREQLLRSLAEDGCDLVFAVGFLFADSISSVSRDYPDTHFALIDGTVPDLNARSSITCVGFAEHEGSFLVGAYAGLIASSAGPDARIGFIGGMDTPLIRRFLSGYSAGAALTNPSLRSSSRIVSAFVARDASGFDDVKRAGELASVLFQAKSAVIYHASGASGRGVMEAAARLGRKVIGVDSDQAAVFAASGDQATALLSKVIVTSMLKRVDRAVYSIGQELVSGIPVAGGYRTFGLAEGGVGYVAEGLPPDAVTVLSDLARKVTSGEIAVPADDQALAEFISTLR
ncbi:MAG: BMP family ABC transporter substrate-binding protein [Spirochaetae bacterium HGW-Spirochaetae-7]|nr:MAG: BMP family ABC transporter substrate-binding protein [Spirochaetae bacterium HGW-Spirochaetae-7]